MTTEMANDTKTIDLVVKINGKEIRRWPITAVAAASTRRNHWWERRTVEVMPAVEILIDGEKWRACGDNAQLTVDIPVEVTA